jgi:uncharacterized protein (DUF1501 family)
MITRRDALKTASAVGVLSAIGGPAFAAATAPTDSRLVVILLRGGADGLALVPAPGDPGFATRRGHLGAGESDQTGDAIPLDGTFALHPRLTALGPLWQAKQLAVVHAVHTVSRNRSHFDAQDLLEIGLNRLTSTADGWLNRTLGYYGDRKPTAGLAVGYGKPLIMRGPTRIATWAPRRLPTADEDFISRLTELSRDDAAIGTALADGAAAARRNRTLLGQDEYATGPSPRSLPAVAQLARATGKLLSVDQGARIATFDIDGWDTHGYQNTALAYRMPYLNDAIDGLRLGLSAAWAKTVVIVATEFGRTAAPNGTTGTDHGTATAALILGGAVAGGQVHADWPGLGQNDLYENRDLMPTTDIRALFKAVLLNHLKIDQAFIEDRIFPGSRAIPPLDQVVVA